MKLIFLALLSYLSSASCSSLKVSCKTKTVEYDKILVVARNRSIFIFQSGVDHSLYEISRLNSSLPIRSIHIVDSKHTKYLFARCNLGSIARVLVWNMNDPERPILIAIRVGI